MFKKYERFRGWIYAVGSAVLLLLGGYGIIANEKVTLWVGVLGAVTNYIAATNTPIRPPDKNHEEETKTPSQ